MSRIIKSIRTYYLRLPSSSILLIPSTIVNPKYIYRIRVANFVDVGSLGWRLEGNHNIMGLIYLSRDSEIIVSSSNLSDYEANSYLLELEPFELATGLNPDPDGFYYYKTGIFKEVELQLDDNLNVFFIPYWTTDALEPYFRINVITYILNGGNYGRDNVNRRVRG